MSVRVLTLAAAAFLTLGATPPASCDRACLGAIATSAVSAIASHRPDALPWASQVRYAENGVAMMVGDGIWATADGHDTAPLLLADPASGQVLWMGRLDEHGQAAWLAMLVQVRGGRIAAIQSVIRRREGRAPFAPPAGPAPLTAPAPQSRAALTAIALRYLAAQSGRAAPPPFAPECRMLENGVAMAGLRPADGPAPCAAAFARRLYQEIEGQRPRIAAVDPQRGMVAVLACRDLPADRAEYRAGSGQPYAPEATYPRSQIIVSVLHVAKGAIARVDTVANEVPYAMPFPWAPPIPRAETR